MGIGTAGRERGGWASGLFGINFVQYLLKCTQVCLSFFFLNKQGWWKLMLFVQHYSVFTAVFFVVRAALAGIDVGGWGGDGVGAVVVWYVVIPDPFKAQLCLPKCIRVACVCHSCKYLTAITTTAKYKTT